MTFPPEDEDVDVVVFHTVVIRVGVVEQPGSDAGQFVGSHSNTDTSPTHEDAPWSPKVHAKCDCVARRCHRSNPLSHCLPHGGTTASYFESYVGELSGVEVVVARTGDTSTDPARRFRRGPYGDQHKRIT